MTTQEAANYLGVQASRIRQLIGDGLIEAKKRGRDWFLRRQALDTYRATVEERNRGKRGRKFRV